MIQRITEEHIGKIVRHITWTNDHTAKIISANDSWIVYIDSNGKTISIPAMIKDWEIVDEPTEKESA